MTVARLPVPSEQDCLRAIVDACRYAGYLVHHSRPGRTNTGWATALTGDAGLPDLLIVGRGRFVAVELKRSGGRVTDGQRRWLDALCAAGVDARVVYVPDEQDALIAELCEGRP